MELKAKYFDEDSHAQWKVLQKELCKIYESSGTEEPLKTVNNADQRHLEVSLELHMLLLKQNYYC